MAERAAPDSDRPLREGFTTGACAAAAARAATRALATGSSLTDIETVLPNGREVVFALARCEISEGEAVCSVIKDAGDDPDCTHGAELVARVRLSHDEGVRLRGGVGVAVVTKPGLGLEVGGPAINPVPRRNITDMVQRELGAAGVAGADVVIEVPDGEERSLKTLNARLGLLGGLSILGTTGIVRPYSTSAFRASVMQGVELAAAVGNTRVVLTTGGRTENYAMGLLPELGEDAFIQVGDFVGVAVRRARAVGIAGVVVVGMVGKLAKMADGRMMTHAAGSTVNVALLAELARGAGADASLVRAIAGANTARHVLELCRAADFEGLGPALCERVAEQLLGHVRGPLQAEVFLVDFDGDVQGRFVAATDADTPPRSPGLPQPAKTANDPQQEQHDRE